MSDWTYQGNTIDNLPENCEAFVYLITNTTNSRKYVGKKLAKFKKTRPPLKGKINKRRSKVESDWKDYWGSNDHLKADVEELGKDICRAPAKTNLQGKYFIIVQVEALQVI